MPDMPKKSTTKPKSTRKPRAASAAKKRRPSQKKAQVSPSSKAIKQTLKGEASVATQKNNRKRPTKTTVKKTPREKVAAKDQTTSNDKSRWSFKQWLANVLPIIGLILGINLMLLSGLYLQYRRTILSFQASPQIESTIDYRAARPKTISLDAQAIQLPVTPAQISGGIWETSDTTATHLASSARPGEGGNVVIYGHNRPHLFRPLHNVKPGDTIAIQTEDNRRYEYEVEEIIKVKPDQIDVVLPTEHEVLTVYTCTGWLDSERLVIKAFPMRVSSL